MKPIVSRPFRVPRVVLARLAAEQYIRTMGWMIVSVPLFGLFAVLMPFGDMVRLTGWVCVTWPLTIPMRGYFVTRKVARRMAKLHHLEVRDEDLYLVPEEGAEPGLKLRRESIHSIRQRSMWLVIASRKFQMVVVDASALDAQDLAAILAMDPKTKRRAAIKST